MGLKSAKYFFKVLLSNTCIHSRTELASISPLWQSLRFQMIFQIMQERRWACLTNCCRRECAPNLSKWDCNVGRGGVGNHTCSLCEKEQEGAYHPDDHTSLQWRGKLTWHNGTLEKKKTLIQTRLSFKDSSNRQFHVNICWCPEVMATN